MSSKRQPGQRTMESELISRLLPNSVLYESGNMGNNGQAGPHVVVNVFRPSQSDARETLLYGLSREYQAEEWQLDYFSVEKDLSLSRRKARCYLPSGYEKAYLANGDAERPEGPLYKVRAWGVEFACLYLQWCSDFLQIRDAYVRTAGEKARWDLDAVGWDLPGHFIIGSEEHPLSALAPSERKYVYDYWCDYETAKLRVAEMNGKESGQ